MTDLPVHSSKRGQLKIQQMAFVLLAFILLFGLVLMFYVSIRLSGLKGDVNTIRHEQAQELVRRLASSPEFSWTVEDCSSCIDMDKVFVLKNESEIYRSLWGTHIQLLRVQTVYPASLEEVECTPATYPECTKITLVDTEEEYTTNDAFVALCRLEEQPLAKQCTLGKIIMGVNTA
ncbi:MAG: hypothetical protein AABX53_04310 [Nanoarchaeota archaeon]